jgi:hypothetical protein
MPILMYKGMERNKRSNYLLIFLVVLSFNLAALEEIYIIGRDDQWNDLISLENTFLEAGKSGFLDAKLLDGEYVADASTDLLLHFDPSEQIFNYEVLENSLTYNEEYAIFGRFAGVAQSQGMKLRPLQKSIFFPGNSWRDFSIEFWLYSASLTEGETVFLWQGAKLVNQEPLNQEIRVRVRDRKLSWKFENFFAPADLSGFSMELLPIDSLIPRSWSHHILRFNSDTGLLEYLVDGAPQAIAYSNPQNSESGDIYLPFIGEAGNTTISVLPGFTGMIDEFRISSSFRSEPYLSSYRPNSGSITTKAIDLESTDTRIFSISSIENTPGDSDIRYFYRVSNRKTQIFDLDEPWIPFNPGEELPESARGRWLQISAVLYPDGTQSLSPVLSEFTILYEPDLPPLPPAFVSVSPGDGMVEISWTEVTEDDIAGYLLYYGTYPGRYFGRDAGPSPIDVGLTTSYSLKGLTNGQIYYFSVVAYDSADPPHYSEFSVERSTRPNILGQP